MDVAKRLAWFSAYRVHDVAGGVLRLLYRSRGHPRHLSTPIRDARQVADHERLGMAGDGQFALDDDPTRAIERHFKLPARPKT